MNSNRMELVNLGKYYMHYNMDDDGVVWELMGESIGIR
jgi:hypothetical protein